MPLLGTGLIQPMQCVDSASAADLRQRKRPYRRTAFRIGVDGMTAPLQQPVATLPNRIFPDTTANRGYRLVWIRISGPTWLIRST